MAGFTLILTGLTGFPWSASPLGFDWFWRAGWISLSLVDNDCSAVATSFLKPVSQYGVNSPQDE